MEIEVLHVRECSCRVVRGGGSTRPRMRLPHESCSVALMGEIKKGKVRRGGRAAAVQMKFWMRYAFSSLYTPSPVLLGLRTIRAAGNTGGHAIGTFELFSYPSRPLLM